MNSLTTLIAVRHGETDWNVQTRIQGSLDMPLNALGQWQAQQAGKALAALKIDAIYSSDLRRAFDTALAIATQQTQGDATQPVVAEGLRERLFGEFEGKTFAEVEAQHPQEAARWTARDPEFAPAHGGESLLAFRARVMPCVMALLRRHHQKAPGQTVCLVAHGGVMDVVYRAAAGLALQSPRTWSVGNALINTLSFDGERLSVVDWGNGQHLQGADSRTIGY